jgi:hypothetical protein
MKDEEQSDILEHTAVVEREKVLNGSNRDLFLKKAPGICLLYLRLASGSAQERRAVIAPYRPFQSTANADAFNILQIALIVVFENA